MAIDVNNPLEFPSPEHTVVKDLAGSSVAESIDELRATGGSQALFEESGRIIASLQLIPQDERTQADLRVRHANIRPGAPHIPSTGSNGSDHTHDPASKRAEIEDLIRQARDAAA